MEVIAFIVIAYLIGSIPTAVWIGKAKYGIDVREHGSKNAGATNTFRVLGKKPGAIVLAIDILKGFIAVSLPQYINFSSWSSDELIQLQLVLGICAIIGHTLPVFAGFRGGKGVATSLGIIIGIQPFAALICFSAFLIIFISTSYVSLGAITAAILFPFVNYFILHNSNIYLIVFSVVLASAVIYAHKQNINRLIKGEENKMNLFKK